MKKLSLIQQLTFFLLALLVPYGSFFFVSVLPSIFSPSDYAYLIHPFTLIVSAGFITILVFLVFLWKNKKPSKKLVNATIICSHILLWLAGFPLIYTFDRGVITYFIACLVALLVYRISRQVLHQKAQILFAISLFVIFLTGTQSYKDAYCWRKMLVYEKSHQKEMQQRMQSGDTPWQFQFEHNCKESFNFIESLIK